MNNGTVKVLLVEDDEDDYVITRDLLAEIEGARFCLEWVATYDTALEAMVQNLHDVYLVDYRLGKSSGLELLHEAIHKGCKAPIILLTGQGDHEVDVDAMKAGAADYLDKGEIGAALLEHSIRYAIERKRTEQKIREQAALLDIATDAILVQDLENNILFWNKGAEHLYGWKVEEALGKNTLELFDKEKQPQPKAVDVAIAESGEWFGELSQVTKNGQDIIVASRWTLVYDEHKRPKSILIVNTNITQKKQLEAQFLRAQRMESIGTLASGIAHDLNNVLAPILMTVQLLEMKIQDEQSQEWLEILETNAKRAASLVKQVLSFARGLEGKRTLLQVKHLIVEIKQIIQETFPKFIQVYVDIPQELWPVSGDATQLHQVLINLCVNARDAMPDGGILKITAENLFIDESYTKILLDAKIGSYIVISVTDTGIGIPPEILDRIFEPFFTTKELGKGTGLGLSTVTGIIKSHGGFINVNSKVGKGTEFKVYLPANVQVTEANSSEEKRRKLPRGQGELILVVDDETAICDVTKRTLEAYGYKVLTAKDGIDAVALYAQHKEDISVVLIDMMMPVMDGPTTIRTLQKMNPNVKIIATSGLASSYKLVEVMRIGAKKFLTKPFTGEELLQTLHQINHLTSE